MVVDDDDGEKVTQTECPSCHRLFCAQCEVPWHAGSGCKETNKKTRNSDKEDALLIDLAKKKKWRRSGALNANSTLRKPLVVCI